MPKTDCTQKIVYYAVGGGEKKSLKIMDEPTLILRLVNVSDRLCKIAWFLYHWRFLEVAREIAEKAVDLADIVTEIDATEGDLATQKQAKEIIEKAEALIKRLDARR
jgi:hypothetical protein